MGKKSRSASPKDHRTLEPVADADPEGDSKFARALGSGDFHTRDQGLQALIRWLQAQQSVDEASLMKLWKGIVFCFWHSDKFPVQQDLAKRLAGILSQVSDEVGRLYFRAFLATLLHDWGRIDKLRLDKFMMLVRYFFAELFTLFADRGWDKAQVRPFMKILRTHGFHAEDATARVGFSLHVADVYVAELMRAAERRPEAALSHGTCVRLLRPWIAVAQATQQPALLARIKSSVFEGFFAVLQAAADEEPSPWRLCDPAKLAAALSDAGAEAHVRARNRAVLYELSTQGERGARKRKRSSGVSGAASPAQQAVAQPGGGKKKAKRVAVAVAAVAQEGVEALNGAVARDAAEAHVDAATLDQRVEAVLCDAEARAGAQNGAVLDTAGGDMQRAVQTAVLQAAASTSGATAAVVETVAVVTEGVPAGGGAGAHAAENGATADDEAAQGKKRKKKKRRASAPAAPGGGGAAAAEPTRRGASLSPGVKGAAAATPPPQHKRRISFNLERNVVHQIGKPLPPAELRTPPSARPNGSALKKVSSLGRPAGTGLQGAKKRLSFGGSGSGAPPMFDTP